MSIIQFPTEENPGTPITYDYQESIEPSLRIEMLPEFYSSAKKLNLTSNSDISPPLSTPCTPDYEYELLTIAISTKREWLEKYDLDGYGWTSFNAPKV